jgi:spore germination cell wall hydrolase CwlJ-like protein
MISIVRASGIAAAAVALAATATFAAPSVAGELDPAPRSATYIDHATASIDTGATAENSADAAAEVASEGDLSEHELAAIASNMVETAGATMPGSRSLQDMVVSYASTETPDREQECLAGAVYFEARGESLEGQLAVAEVVINRAASGRYPPSLCAVVTQKAQFSFIRAGKFPPIARGTEAWRKAVAVAHIARQKLADRVAPGVLWYHADYVAPVWRRNLTRVAKIGVHIFYS